jgi:hypothetical protein
MRSRREFLKVAAGAAAIGAAAPSVLRAQGKGKVRLAYLQLGWAGTEIIHKEDLLGKRGGVLSTRPGRGPAAEPARGQEWTPST